jgi:hypothetical protein
MEDKIPSSTNTNIAEDNSKVSSALVVAAKKPEDLVEEDIDSQILSILGLEDVFDLTYEEYASLLKEAAVKGRMPGSQMTTESVELVTNELKRVKNKTGRFKVKPKKVNINKVLDRKQPTPPGAIVKAQKLIPAVAEEAPEQEKKLAGGTDQEDLSKGIGNILESLITIRGLLQSEGKTEQKAAQEDRKEIQKKKKKERESKLEAKKPTSPILKALTKPVDDFFGAIKRFFTNVLLGSVVLGMFKWLKDPANQKAVDGFSNFLQKNAGLILGGLLAIAVLPLAPTLLSLTTAVIGGIGMLGTALGGLTTLLPAFGLFGAFIGGQMLFKNIQKFAGGEDAPAVESELYKLKKDLVLRKGQAQLMSGKEKEQSLKKIQEDEKKLNRIEQELLPRMTKTQSMKRQLEQTKQKLKKDEEELKKLRGYEGTPFYKAKLKDIEISKKIIAENEKNIPISQKEQDKLMKDIMGPEGAQGDVIDKINKFVKDAQKMVENLNTGVQPQTSLMPGLPPSAAQPGTGPAGNQVGSGSATFGETGNVSNAPGFVHGHFQTDTGTANDLVNDTAPIVKGLLDSGVTPELSKGQKFTPGMSMEEIKKLIRIGITQHGHSGDGRSVDIFVPKGTKVPFPLADVRNTGGKGGVTGILPGSGKVWVGHLAPTSKSGMMHTPVGETAQVAQTPPTTPSIPSPTGRSNIVPIPIPTGGGTPQVSSGTSPNQAPVPRFSSEDPNNTTTMVVRAIYNIVG